MPIKLPVQSCLAISFLITSIFGCSVAAETTFGSAREAMEACEEWAERGGSYKTLDAAGYTKSHKVRSCEHEVITQQYLGLAYPVPGYVKSGTLKGATLGVRGSWPSSRKFSRRFRYGSPN